MSQFNKAFIINAQIQEWILFIFTYYLNVAAYNEWLIMIKQFYLNKVIST